MINTSTIHEPSFERAIEMFAMVPKAFLKRGLELAVNDSVSSIDVKKAIKKWQNVGWLNNEDAESIIALMNARTYERPHMDLLDIAGDNACLKIQ